MTLEKIKMHCLECGDCLLWQGSKNDKGHPTAGPRSARRVVWELAKGRALKPSELVAVTCGQKGCLNPEHLTLTNRSEVSAKSNARPAVKLKRSASAARTNQARLGKIDMDKARYIRSSDKTGRHLASELGVSPALISHVRCNMSWKDHSSPFAGLLMAADAWSRS